MKLLSAAAAFPALAGAAAWKQEYGLETFELLRPEAGAHVRLDYWENTCGSLPNYQNVNSDNYEVLYRQDMPAVEGQAYYPMIQAILVPTECEQRGITTRQERGARKAAEKAARIAVREA